MTLGRATNNQHYRRFISVCGPPFFIGMGLRYITLSIMAEYTPLSQDSTRPSTPTMGHRDKHGPNDKQPLYTFGVPHKALCIFLIAAMVINLACIFQTSRMVASVFGGMHGRGEVYTDTRDLPRANIYDGLLVQ